MLIIQVAFASVKVALKVRDGGPKTPCKWPYRVEIYTSALAPKFTIDNARIYNKAVRYFSFASWARCAEQVADEDR